MSHERLDAAVKAAKRSKNCPFIVWGRMMDGYTHEIDRFKTVQEARDYLKSQNNIPAGYDAAWLKHPGGDLIAFYSIGRRER